MYRDIFKQMVPFIILLGVLWLMAEFLDAAFEEQSGPKILDKERPATPTPDSE